MKFGCIKSFKESEENNVVNRQILFSANTVSMLILQNYWNILLLLQFTYKEKKPLKFVCDYLFIEQNGVHFYWSRIPTINVVRNKGFSFILYKCAVEESGRYLEYSNSLNKAQFLI